MFARVAVVMCLALAAASIRATESPDLDDKRVSTGQPRAAQIGGYVRASIRERCHTK
jgi:hypothetical protein